MHLLFHAKPQTALARPRSQLHTQTFILCTNKSMPSSPRRAERVSSEEPKYKYKELVEEIYGDDAQTKKWVELLLTLPTAKLSGGSGLKSPTRKKAMSPTLKKSPARKPR
ncbi:MAG: hypothetical protein EB015_17065 [Methylocystaceae bacterium]|nr:hypothetical protein [Methylocystaceae bacterium]